MVERKLHPRRFFNKEEKERIVRAIQSAEKGTSGEIRIHLDCMAHEDVMEHAKKLFQRKRLHRRKHRNAVLIYLSLADRSFAILGDEGIHQRVGDSFWKEVAGSMQIQFSRGQFLEGLEQAIRTIGDEFRKHFALSATV